MLKDFSIRPFGLGLMAAILISTVSGCSTNAAMAKNEMASNKVIATEQLARHDFPYKSHFAEILGSKMHFVDTGGDKDPILMIHGQPTWSYLWRDIIPQLEQNHRVIAIDLIGFGKSDKPDINYTIEEHAKYVEALIEALALDDITMVIHDWGSFLGFDYAAQNPDKVKALAFMEAIIPTNVREPEGSENRKIMDGFFKVVEQIRTPGVGEKMILEDNFFIEQILLNNPGMTEDEKNAYREPFAKGKNRLPMLQFPRQITFDGVEPKYVVAGFNRIQKYLTTNKAPKLLMTFNPGGLVGPAKTEWAKQNMPNLQHKHIGEGVHFVQEDHGEAIGKTIGRWMNRNGL